MRHSSITYCLKLICFHQRNQKPKTNRENLKVCMICRMQIVQLDSDEVNTRIGEDQRRPKALLKCIVFFIDLACKTQESSASCHFVNCMITYHIKKL